MALRLNGELVYPLSEEDYSNLNLVWNALAAYQWALDGKTNQDAIENAQSGFLRLLQRELETVINNIDRLNQAT